MDNILNKIMDMAKMEGIDFKDPNYDEVTESFNLKCPVKKINFKNESPSFIAGMWLISSPNGLDKAKEKADISDLDDNTLLFFENRHVVEIGQVMYGMLSMAKGSKVVFKEGIELEDVFNIVIKLMNGWRQICTYEEYKELYHSIVIKNIHKSYPTVCKESELATRIRVKIQKIYDILPFISYNELDNIAKTAIEDYEKSLGDKNG